MILLDARRLAGLHQIDRLQHRLDAHGKQPVEIDRAERVVRADVSLLLQQHVAGIEPVVGPEDRQPGLVLALDDGPVDRTRSAVFRQKRGMILDRPLGRNVEKFLWHEQRDEGHHLQFRLERPELFPHLGLAVGGGLIDRKLRRERGLLERIGLGALLLRRHIHRDDVVAALAQRFQHRLAECLLAVHHDTHAASFPIPRVIAGLDPAIHPKRFMRKGWMPGS
jgi:hypothetical protein